METIAITEIASRLRQRRIGKTRITEFITQCEWIDAIPLAKVKQAREEIKEKAFTEEIFGEDICNFTNTESVSKETAECESYVETEVVKLSDILEILDRLIAESEEQHG